MRLVKNQTIRESFHISFFGVLSQLRRFIQVSVYCEFSIFNDESNDALFWKIGSQKAGKSKKTSKFCLDNLLL